MTDAPTAPGPTAAEAMAWVGCELDCVDEAGVGRVHGVFVDADSGVAAWLVVALTRRGRGLLGRRRATAAVAIPARECAGMAGRAWTALDAAALRTAPAVDPARPLLREHELAVAAHYGIGENEGRRAEVAPRPKGSITAQPT
jgi:hypothetical protein